MTFDDKLDKILLTHGAEQGELHYSLKQAIKDLVLKEIIGEDTVTPLIAGKPQWGSVAEHNKNELRADQRLIINGKESSNEQTV